MIYLLYLLIGFIIIAYNTVKARKENGNDWVPSIRRMAVSTVFWPLYLVVMYLDYTNTELGDSK